MAHAVVSFGAAGAFGPAAGLLLGAGACLVRVGPGDPGGMRVEPSLLAYFHAAVSSVLNRFSATLGVRVVHQSTPASVRGTTEKSERVRVLVWFLQAASVQELLTLDSIRHFEAAGCVADGLLGDELFPLSKPLRCH